jgi:glyoxylase-like metal-dependent hydrolase (beta-lactamase superfamily II)
MTLASSVIPTSDGHFCLASTKAVRALLRTTLALLLLAAPVPASSQDMSDVTIGRVPLGDGLAMLTGRGGNIGVAFGADGVFLVDDQYAPLTEKIRAAVAKLSDQPIRFVLNTHWHGDHTGGNENLGLSGAVIVAHDNVRSRMSVEQVMAAFDRTVPASPHAALPVITFAESVTFHLNGDELHAFHVDPAHTDGDAIVHWKKANVVHMGDTFFNGVYPFIDLSSGGDVEGMVAAGERVLALSDAETRIIPGHGPLADRADLEGYVAMLKTVRGRIAKEVAAGRSLDEILAAKPTADFDAQWGGGFMKPESFTRFVAMSLGAK